MINATHATTHATTHVTTHATTRRNNYQVTERSHYSGPQTSLFGGDDNYNEWKDRGQELLNATEVWALNNEYNIQRLLFKGRQSSYIWCLQDRLGFPSHKTKVHQISDLD